MEELQQDKFEQGQQTKALEIARRLLAKGDEPATVTEITGISADELAAISF
jgi:predicted transposase YdaD